MNRMDFSSVASIIRKYINEINKADQLDFLYRLFDAFINDEKSEFVVFDQGLACKWMNGKVNLSPKILTFYTDDSDKGIEILAEDIREQILPIVYDEDMLVRDLTDLLMNDMEIGSREKRKLGKIKRKDDTADFVSKLLVYTMRRHFIKCDSKVAKAIEDGNRSPAVTDRIFADLPPKPCKYFCGRDGEVEALAKLIDENDKVFVTGIGGIGKSEVVRAYAHKYMRAYTNVLYITYTGNLRDDILRLDFVDDVNGEDMKERFTRHVRFLKSLREDSLIIIDNFNTTPAKEHLYADIMKYRCKVIFTTRSRFKDESCIEIKEIEEKIFSWSLSVEYLMTCQSTKR